MFSSATYGFIGEARSGIERAERAIRLSPLDQQVFVSYARLAQNHYLNDSHEDALRWSRKALSLNPRFGNAIRVAADFVDRNITSNIETEMAALRPAAAVTP